MDRRQLHIWASILAVALATAAGTVFILDQFFPGHRERATSWEPRGVSEDGRTITIEYVADEGACDSLERVDRTETASIVTLTVILRTRNVEDCADISIHYTREVELERPLGSRRLIDARTGSRPEY